MGERRGGKERAGRRGRGWEGEVCVMAKGDGWTPLPSDELIEYLQVEDDEVIMSPTDELIERLSTVLHHLQSTNTCCLCRRLFISGHYGGAMIIIKTTIYIAP